MERLKDSRKQELKALGFYLFFDGFFGHQRTDKSDVFWMATLSLMITI